MKSLKELQNILEDDTKSIDQYWISQVKWYLENDIDPSKAMIMATDTHIEEFIPLIGKYLDYKKDGYLREVASGCIGRFKSYNYGDKLLEIAMNDIESGPRAIATMNLGWLIEGLSCTLQKKVGQYLVSEAQKKKEDLQHFSASAYFSIICALGDFSLLPKVVDFDPKIDIQDDKIEEFRKIYDI